MKNILFILPSIRGGGAERVVIDMIRNLDRDKFMPTLLLIQNDGVYWNEIPKWLKVITILEKDQLIALRLWKVFFYLFKFARVNDIIVGSLELYTTYLSIIAGKLFGKKVVGWVHIELNFRLKYCSSVERFINMFFLKLLYPLLDKIIAVSDGAKESVLQIVDLPKEKVCRIYNPIDFMRIENCLKNSIIHHDETYMPCILNIGRLEIQKNQALLIKAHAQLIAKGITHRLLILGDGPEKEKLEQLIKMLNVQDTVSLIGFQNNPYAWLKKADVFVMSSIYEGFGLVIVEAMYIGIPVISTDCPSGPLEILNDGKYGMLVESNNEDMLADAILKILKNKNFALHLATIGHKRAQDFNVKNVIKNIEQVFLNL